MCGFLAWQAGIASQFVDPSYKNQGVGIAGLVSIFLFSGAFSASFGPVSWIYQSEIFPMNQRALGTAVSTAANWLNNVIIGQITPYGFAKLGWKYFFVYVATNASNAVVSYFLFPETKGESPSNAYFFKLIFQARLWKRSVYSSVTRMSGRERAWITSHTTSTTSRIRIPMSRAD
jgi:MFS family permease